MIFFLERGLSPSTTPHLDAYGASPPRYWHHKYATASWKIVFAHVFSVAVFISIKLWTDFDENFRICNDQLYFRMILIWNQELFFARWRHRAFAEECTECSCLVFNCTQAIIEHYMYIWHAAALVTYYLHVYCFVV